MTNFKTQFRGYNKQEVDDLLEDNKTKTKELEETIESLKSQISTLQDQNTALSHRVDVTEKTNEEIARLALKEASELIDKAKRNANMILTESLEYVRSLSGEMSDFKSQAIEFRSSVEKMSKDILDTIDQSEVYNLINEDRSKVDE